MYNIHDCLKELGLKKNHIRIIELLLENVDKGLSAKEISKKLKLPLTRTYFLLNNLFQMNLIDKKVDKNIKFYISDIETNFRRLFNSKYEEIRRFESNFYDIIIPKYKIRKSDTVLLYSHEEVYRTIYQIILNANTIKIFAKTPLLLLPRERKGFWRSKLFELYKQKIVSSTDFYYLIDLNIIKRKINKRNIKEVKRSFKWLKQYPNFHMKNINGKNMLSTVLTNNEVLLSFHYMPLEKGIHSGIILRSKEIIKFFSLIYDEVFNKAKNIDKFI